MVPTSTEGESKADIKPTMYAESGKKHLGQTMTTSFKCAARECAWKTEEMILGLATEHLELHHEANHGIHGVS